MDHIWQDANAERADLRQMGRHASGIRSIGTSSREAFDGNHAGHSKLPYQFRTFTHSGEDGFEADVQKSEGLQRLGNATCHVPPGNHSTILIRAMHFTAHHDHLSHSQRFKAEGQDSERLQARRDLPCLERVGATRSHYNGAFAR